jgi:hypothetical protein
MIFPVLLAKFLSAGAIAQAATGAGVAVVVVTGAGVAGVLPDPVQNTVSTVVETVTPIEVPTAEEPVPGEPAVAEPGAEEPVVAEPVDGEPVVEEPVVAEPVVEEPGTEDAAFNPEKWVADGPPEGESFGAWVSASAHKTELREWLRAKGRNFGSMVREWAHEKGLDDQDLIEEGVDLDDLTDVPAEPAPVVQPGTEDESTEDEAATTDTTEGGGHGKGADKGSGKGSDKGNGKNGNGGKGNGNSGGSKGNGRN